MNPSTPNKDPAPVCLVTGGSSGIGLATAKRFAANGNRVLICGRDESKLAIAKADIDQAAATAGRSGLVRTYAVDLADVEQTKAFAAAALQAFGRVDVLVNNAGMAPLAEFDAISAESFEATTNVNMRSVFYLTQAIWRSMKNRPDTSTPATIVNVSSLSAVDPFPGFSLYGASKAWIDLLTQSLATEGEGLGIRVCSVRPGAVETPLLRGLFPDFPAEQCVSAERVAKVIWNCVAKPADFPSGQAFRITDQPENQ